MLSFIRCEKAARDGFQRYAKMTIYNEVRSELHTGDIVLFSSSGFISSLIKLATNSKWSHVGMVLTVNDINSVFILESTSLNDYKSGVQISLLSERVERHDGQVAIRHLENFTLTPERYKALGKLRDDIKGREYEKDKLELIKSAYDGIGGDNQEDLTSIFCSELVAECYQAMGILGDKMPSNEYTPADFSEKKDIKFMHPQTSLSDEIFIKI